MDRAGPIAARQAHGAHRRLRPGRPALRAVAVLAASAAVAAACGCIVPHLRHIERVEDVERVAAGGATREQVREQLGAPTMTDTPRLYVYEWEKARALAYGYLGVAAMGHVGTRALFVFDDDGRVVRVETTGTGQDRAGHAAAGTSVEATQLPVASVEPLGGGECGRKGVGAVLFGGPEPRLFLRHRSRLKVCDAHGTRVLADHRARIYDLAISPDGRTIATYERGYVLALRDGTTLAARAILEAPPIGLLGLSQWASDLSFSGDGSRVAGCLGDGGVTVYEAATGEIVQHLPGRWAPRLAHDGRWLVSKGQAGVYVTDLSTGDDLAVRPRPEYPYKSCPAPVLSRWLKVRLGTTAFSPDGRRVAIATCAHAEVWDLEAAIRSNWERGLEDAVLLPFANLFGICAASLAFSADGATLAAANESSVTLYDLRAHAIRAAYALPEPTVEMSFTRDLAEAVFMTADGPMLWKVPSESLASTPRRE